MVCLFVISGNAPISEGKPGKVEFKVDVNRVELK